MSKDTIYFKRPQSDELPPDAKVLTLPNNTKKVQKMQVSKVIPLVDLVKSDLRLNQLKLLDLYLARINSKMPDERYVCISSRELAMLLHVKKVDAKYMRNLVEGEYDDKGKLIRPGLLGYPVRFDDPQEAHTEVLFSTAKYRKDSDGIYSLILGCSEEARKYIFFEGNIRYLRTKIFYTINLKSKYSYALYYFLLREGFRNKRPRTFMVPIDVLREELHAVEDTYKDFRRFNSLILKPATKEVNEKTDVRFDCNIVKRGKTAVAIQFAVACMLSWNRAVDYIEHDAPYEQGSAAVFAEDQAQQDWEKKLQRRGAVTEKSLIDHYGIEKNASCYDQDAIDKGIENIMAICEMQEDINKMRKKKLREYHALKDEVEMEK